MSKDIGISFNMNPRWVGEEGLDAFLNPLRQVGLDTLEFELDRFLPEWPQMEPLIGECADAGMKLCFHAPYRSPNRIEGFSNERRAEVQAMFRPALAIAQGWAEKLGTPINMVVHGARSTAAQRETLREDTLQFLKWALHDFPGIYFAFENNHPAKPGEIKIGETRADVLDVVNNVHHPNLGICWDFGHDFLSAGGKAVSADWLAQVIHVHVHDVDRQNVDHYPLVFNNVPYSTWLPLLRSADRLRVATLELKGGLMMGWSQDRIQAALIDSVRVIKVGI
ncbi:sugar phosphate isomerase/epimerase [Longilinea arvoryzae]|uniref:Sugar phosphate isomerase/epimerase n=1 Tax=Longilinea arvoryzae TaxID=360412 RepID=A0A0S7BHC1_9CHLR|nr:TIM barrel protein [Longilinea arvoryzae]GAP13987.1 sugar phosphate isomerase/epimerase [Longilinea arvoryzae]